MRHHNHTRHSSPAARHLRPGFTLVEMLVSMALILFVMVLLTAAFSTGLQVFRQLKGLGDMEEHLRSTAQILRRDLTAYHFQNTVKLSDPTFWDNGPPQQGFFRIWQGGPSTTEGLDADGNPSLRATNHILHFTSKLSGQGQGDFATSSVPTTLPVTGGADSRYQQSGQFRGRWYEVVYFLRANGLVANGTGTPLFTLYRRQLGVLDVAGSVSPTLASQLTAQAIQVATGNDWAAFSEIACKKNGDITTLRDPIPSLYSPADTVRFSSPADLTMPARRFGMLPAAAGSNEMAGIPANPLRLAAAPPAFPVGNRTYPFLAEVPGAPSLWSLPAAQLGPYFNNPPCWQNNSGLQGADLLLSDVISFDVQSFFAGATDFSDIPVSAANTLFSAAGIGVFDTWSNQNDGTYDYSNSSATGTSASIPTPTARILALKISIRVWDAKTLQARQITIIQDM